jgi:hypothetical protein
MKFEQLKKALSHPIISFIAGILLTTMYFLMPLLLIGVAVIILIFAYVFRDYLDFSFKTEKIDRITRKKKTSLACPECGSKTKHSYKCSHNPRNKEIKKE